jgi:hypothetical protein
VAQAAESQTQRNPIEPQARRYSKIKAQSRLYNFRLDIASCPTDFPSMERKLKGTPPRLPILFQHFDAPLYFVTFNTLLKRSLLANDAVHAAFRNYTERGLKFNVVTGRYVLMPDHIHVFVRIGRDMTLRQWESGLKQSLAARF